MQDILSDLIVDTIAQPYKKANYSGYEEDPVSYIREKLRANITPDQVNICQSLIKHNKVMVTSCHDCLHKDAMVTLSDGSYVRSEELINKKFELLTLDENQNIVSTPAECYRVDDSRMYKITTETGRVFMRNYSHPFWAANIQKRTGNRTLTDVKEWTRVMNLVEGDYIAVTENLPAFGDEKIDSDFIKVAAYLIGDGSIGGQGVQFTQKDAISDQTIEFIQCVTNLNCSIKTADNCHYNVNGKRDNAGKIIGENFVLSLLKKYKMFGQKSADKHIPEEFFRLNKEEMKIFISRLFSTDGWYYTNKGKNKSVEVGFCFMSERLVRDIAQLCLRFGVNGKIRYRGNVNAWVYEINQSKEVIKFIERIGIWGKKEKEKKTLKVAYELFESKRSHKWRDRKSPKNTKWEKIISIEDLGEDVTINIEVPEYGHYLTEAWDKNSGKCKHKEDYIYLSNGKRVKAKELVDTTFKILTISDNEIVEADAKAEWNLFEDIYQVTTESGRKISINANHPLWKATETKTENGFDMTVQGWTPLKDVKVGNLLAVTQEFPAFGEKNAHKDDLKLLAHLISNSYVEFDRITIIKKSQEQFDELSALLRKKGAYLSVLYQENRYTIEFSNKIQDLLWGYGVSKSFYDRKIPDIVMDNNEEGLICFLKSLFSSNNLIIKNENESKFKFYHRSEQLVRDISFLLLKFGINTKIYQKENGLWVLRIINIEDFVKVLFIEEMDYMLKDNPDSRLQWRFKNAPENCYWEKIKEIKWIAKDWTVAISVDIYESYLTDFYEHNSYLAGALVNWNYDCFAESISLTTAPNEEVVKDVIWNEIRNHRNKIPEAMRDLAPKDMRIQNGPKHFATGYVAANEAGARGRKSSNIMIIFDEADGIRSEFFDSAEGMLIGENARHLVLLNPVHLDSRAALEEENFHVIRLSALTHPNVVAELNAGGELPREMRPYPAIGMNLGWVNNKIQRWTREIGADNVKLNSNDFQWPPSWMYEDPKHEKFLAEIGAEEPKYYRVKPNTEFEPRVLGQWMTNSEISMWNDAMWEAAMTKMPLDEYEQVQIGIDPAGQGKDSTVFCVVKGNSALHMESHEGWDTLQIVERAKILATEYGCEDGMTAETVPVKIDQTGNRALYDLRAGFNFIPVNSSETALDRSKYPNRRSELWFNVADKANELRMASDGSFISNLDISRLVETCPEEAKELKRQLKAAEFKNLSAGRREVEKKASMQKKLKRSPDQADAFNLAFSNYEQEGGTRTFISSAAASSIRRHLGHRFRK